MTARSLIVVILLIVRPLAADDNWTRFRGKDGTGVAADHPSLPLTWTTSENVSWVADVPGWGWSCPIVWGDQVFVTTVISDQQNPTPSKGLYLGEGVRDPAKGVHRWMVYCFDLKTGQELWKHEAHTGEPRVPRHPKSTYAAETPTTDGQRLYVLFGDVGLYCYDLDGKPLWSRPIEPKKTFQDYGAAASPVVHDGQVILVYDNLGESWIAAFDTATGDERWQKPRDETHSWATPLVWENDVRTEIVVPGKKRNRSYSLDGELLWEFDGRMSNLVIPSPFVAHGLCYIASGYIGDRHRPTFAIRPGAIGNITPDGDFSRSEHIAWYQPQASSYNPTQLVYGDYLYTLYDRGFLTCHNAKTGEEVYGKRRFEPRGSFTASPWAYNGHMFFLSEDGLTYVVKAGPEFEIVGTSDLGELCLSTPSIAGDRLLIRTASAVYCLTEGAKLPEEIAQRRMKKTAAPDIWSAARDGNVAAVASAIEAVASVSARNGNGMTPLMLASLYGRTRVAELLLKNNADVAASSKDGNTALHMAAFLAHPEIVRLLLAGGASPDARNGKGETPIGNLSAPWSDELAGVYGFIGNLIGEELDLERIRKTRSEVLKLLKDADRAWNQFRGPNGNGKSSAKNLPVEFDEAKHVRWKVPIPDEGWSSPVVWGNEIWLTTGSDQKRELRAICVDLESGKILKDIKVFDMIERKVDPAYAFDSPHLNSPATPTSVVEEDRVFVSFGSQGIACLDRKTGEKVWERRDLRIYQPVRQGSSPIVDDRNLYVAFDGTDEQFFVALDKKTGETRWKTERNVETDWVTTLRARGLSPKKGGKPNDNKKSFATATLIEVDGQRQLLAPAAEATISYNPDTGEELWRVLHPGGFNVAARPIHANGLVYVFTSGLTGYLLAIDPDGTGDVTDTHVVWSTTRSTPTIPSPVIVDDLLFMVTDKGGIARCLAARTGEELWKKRLGGSHWASPLYADGKLYFSSKQGDVTVLPASREEPEILARNSLNAGFIASPAVARSSLILRTTTHLYCIQNGYERRAEKTKSDMDWDAAYEKLLKTNPAVRAKVKSGGATKDQIIVWLKWREQNGGKADVQKATDLSKEQRDE